MCEDEPVLFGSQPALGWDATPPRVQDSLDSYSAEDVDAMRLLQITLGLASCNDQGIKHRLSDGYASEPSSPITPPSKRLRRGNAEDDVGVVNACDDEDVVNACEDEEVDFADDLDNDDEDELDVDNDNELDVDNDNDNDDVTMAEQLLEFDAFEDDTSGDVVAPQSGHKQVVLSEEQQQVLNSVLDGYSIFFTGSAGTPIDLSSSRFLTCHRDGQIRAASGDCEKAQREVPKARRGCRHGEHGYGVLRYRRRHVALVRRCWNSSGVAGHSYYQDQGIRKASSQVERHSYSCNRRKCAALIPFFRVSSFK